MGVGLQPLSAPKTKEICKRQKKNDAPTEFIKGE